jgi:hypothetical protein
VNSTVTIFEVTALDAALAVSCAMAITISAISIVVAHLGADDRTDGETTNDASRDFAIFRKCGFRPDNDSQHQAGNGEGGNKF